MNAKKLTNVLGGFNLKKRLLISLAVIVALSMVLAACSKSNNSQPAASPGNVSSSGSNNESSAGQKDITIDFWIGPTYKNVEGTPSEEFGDYEQAMIDEFQKQNPNIKVNLQLIGWTDIEQKITVALAGDNQPDIILEALDRRLSKYQRTGKMEDISDFYDPSQFHDAFMDSMMMDGGIYGIPISMNPEAVFLNKTIFKNKGLEHLIPADRDWTFDEVKAALEQVTGDGVYGTVFFAANEQGDENILSYYFGMGGEQWNAEETQVVMDQYSEAEEFVQMMKDMVDRGIAAPGPASTDVLAALELFKQGKVAMFPFAVSLYSTIEAGKADGSALPDLELYAIKPLHKEGVQQKATIAGIHGYGVFKQSDPEKREAIKKFVQFMTTPENIKLMAKSGGYMPSHKDASYELDNEDFNAIMKELSTLPAANLGKKSEGYNEVRVMWFPELQAALSGKKTPKQAIEDYAKKANDFLNSL